MIEARLQELQLKLRYTWRLSRNASDLKTNFYVILNEDGCEGMGEVAPNIRYHETPELIREQFQGVLAVFNWEEKDLFVFSAQLQRLQLCSSLAFGIESAFLHLRSQQLGVDVCNILGVDKPSGIKTFYSIPVMEVAEIPAFYENMKLERFTHLKIKVNQDHPEEAVSELFRISGKPIAIDANEAWKDSKDVLACMKRLVHIPVLFIEQPMPADRLSEYKLLKKSCPFPLMADESLYGAVNPQDLSEGFHGVNVKLMKAGGYLRGIELLRMARQEGMMSMVGCMVETTLGISSAMRLGGLADYADLDGFMLLEHDPVGLVSESVGELHFV